MPGYAAFLRGINVGGHNTVSMVELATTFSSLGFLNVRTVLASGNVLFDTPRSGVATLERTIAKALAATFGFEIDVLLRSIQDLERLVASAPFRGIQVTSQTRLYVTFLAEKSKSVRPYTSADGQFRLFAGKGREVFSVLSLSGGAGSVDLMKVIEQRFGRKVTTRNWNTVVRLLGTGEGV
jgi:uncharacterized protein (DUF1697 family)